MLALILHSDAPLDDDQIAQAAQMNRVYVNVICRQLAEDGLTPIFTKRIDPQLGQAYS